MPDKKSSTAETKFHALMNYAGDAIFMIDQAFCITEVNKSACDLLNYSAEELQGMKMQDIIAPDEQQSFVSKTNRVEQEGGSLHERKLKRKDGSLVDTEVNVRAVEGIGYISIIRDTTERKAVSEKMRQNEERYKSIITVSNTGAWEFHTDTSFLWCSHEYFNMLGRNLEQFDISGSANLKETWTDLLHPEDRERATSHFAEYLSNGSVGTYENYFRMLHTNGHWIWIRSRGQTLRDSEGQLTNLTVGTHIDITELKNAETKILERDSLLTAVFDNMEGSLALYDVHKKIVLFNNRFAANYKQLTGQEPKVGDAAYNFLSHEMMKEPSQLMDSAINGYKEVFEKDYLSNGKYVRFRTSFSPVIHNGKVTGVTSFSLDITKSKEAEIKIRESEEKFRLSFMTSQDAFYIGSLNEGRIIDVNDSFIDLFGYSREEAIGKTSLELNLYVDAEDRARMVAGLRANGNLKDLELKCRRKNGDLIEISITVNIWEMNNEQVLMAVIRDVTHRKRIERELLESKEQLTLFIEHSPASLAMFDTDMRYIATSRRWMNDYNLGKQNITGRSHYEIFPEIGQDWKDIHHRCLQGAIERSEEERFDRLDGTTDWLKWEVRPWRKSTGEIGGIIMFTEVITSQKESELRFKNLVEESPFGVYIIQNRKFVYVNARFEKDLGYTRKELMSMDDTMQIVSSDNIPYAEEQHKRRVVDGAKNMDMELRYRRKDGRIIWGSVHSATTRYKGGEAVIGSLQDITERKKATELFRYQFENSPDIILIINTNYTIESINRSRPNGPSPAELVGRNCIEVLPEESKAISRESIGLCFETGINQEIENKLLGDKWVRSRFVPIRIDGNITHMMIIATDITERKIAVENLQRSEEKNRALIENISDTIILLNENAEFIYQSPRYVRTAGLSLNDLKNKTVFDLMHPGDKEEAKNLFAQAMDNPGVPLQTQYRVLHKRGHYFWAEGTMMSLLENESVKAIIINYRDISDRKNLELEREKTIAELLQRNRDLEQFSYIVSHDIRGPVATIKGLSDILRNIGLDEKEKEKLIYGMGDSAHKLDVVISDLNTILEVKRNLSEKKELISFPDLVNDIRASLSGLMVNENVEFICNFNTKAGLSTIKSYLYSIFYNLISNSIKYRRPESDLIIEITSEERDTQTIIKFKDNGLGMDLQEKGRDVFGLYKRFHAHTEGKGMGLFMVKTQVEALGGSISIRSQVNAGTEFTIVFEN